MRNPGVTKEIATGVIVRAWTQCTSLLVVIMAGRVLERQEFGVFAIASVFSIILSTIIYSGTYEYLITSDDYKASADTCFWMNIGFASCGAIIMIAIAPLISHIVHEPAIMPLMIWLAPSAILASLTSWQEALVLRRKRVVSYYIILFFAETASAALAVVLFLSGARVYALIGYRFSGLVLSSAGYLLCTRDFPRFHWRSAEARVVLAFASGLYGSRIINIITNYCADLIIGALASPAAAGSYRLASRIIFGVSEIWFQPIRTIAWVRFSSAVNRGEGLGQEWRSLMMVLSMIAWPVLGGVATASIPLTEAILGQRWLAAAPIVTVLAFAKAAQLLETFLDPLLGTANEAYQLLRIRAVACVVAIAGFLSLAPFGAVPGAWAQTITYLLLAAVTVGVGVKLTGVSIWTSFITLLPGIITTLLTTLAVAGAAAWVSTVGLPPIGRLAIDAGAGALVWAVMIGLVFRRKAAMMIAKLRNQTPRSAIA